MAYSSTTFGALQTQLAQKLDDPASEFWTAPELQFAIQDSMRLWNALACDNRTQYALNLSPATAWYDLQTITGSPRFSSLTDYDLYSRIQYLLIEGPTPLTLATNQFTAADITSAVQLKRDEFLLRTCCTRTVTTLNVQPSDPILNLPDTVINAPRAYWLPTAPTGYPAPLPKSDAFTQTGYQSPAFYNTADPNSFSSGMESVLTVTLYPTPENPGKVEFLTINSQPTLPQSSPVSIQLPDDLLPAIMWGALGYLLSISMEASDKARSDYANARFEEIVELASSYPFIYTARVSGQAIFVDSIENLDGYQSTWRLGQVVPSVIGSAGLNLLGVPTARAQTITLFMLANANVPNASGDEIQLGQEVLDVILDYAQHTLLFKCGGAEFSSSLVLMQNLLSLAAARNDKIKSLSIYRDAMQGTSQRERKDETFA